MLRTRIVAVVAGTILPLVAFAGNPGSPILPGMNIQDPGAASTPWGGCGPADSNCYVDLKVGDFTSVTVNGTTTLTGVTNVNTTGTAATNIGAAGTTTTVNGTVSLTGAVSFTSLPSLPLTSARLLLGNGSNVAAGVALSGDATITNAGVLTIGNSAVTLAKLAADSVNSSKIVDGSVALADLAADSVNSGKIVDGSVALADMAADSVNASKIVDGSVTGTDVATDTLDFANMSNALTLDASTDVSTGAFTYSITNDGAGTSFRVNDNGGADASPFIIDGSGNVGVGVVAPTAQLHTTGTVRFANFGAGTLTTDASGNVTASSDERLKNVTGSFTRGVSDVLKINPISYHWNGLSGLDQAHTYSGFSAQNVQAAIPEAIDTDPRGYLTLQDRPILAAVVNAVKDIWTKVTGQQTDIAELKAEAASLKARVSALEDRSGAQPAAASAPVVAVPVVQSQGQAGTESLPTLALDTVAPVVTINGAAEQTVDLGNSWSDLGATATDNVAVVGEIIASGDGAQTAPAGQLTIDASKAGDYVITYTASDAAGNKGTATRTVHVVAPTPVTAPAATDAPVAPAPATN